MFILASAVLLIVLTVAFTFLVRVQDIPAVPPLSPPHHLEERRSAIYENLRDLQFEYRVGKLSDEDYQQTKVGLQKELAGVMAEMDRMKPGASARGAAQEPAAEQPAIPTCPHCGAQFPATMKFCGECGKAMA
jgi:hypothetical protein